VTRQPERPAAQPVPDDLAEALAIARGRLGPFGTPFHFFASVSSTNDIADRLALDGAPEGLTVVAEAQTAGRGRLGRVWFSPPGAGLYASVVLRPSATPSASLCTLVAGVALAEALRAVTGVEVLIKWPNDLVIGSRKLCGILAEGFASHGSIQHVVVGFGINLRSAAYPPDVAERATSIEAELGRPIERGIILAAALEALATRFADLRALRFDAILNRWRSLAPSSVGSTVEWRGSGGLRRGTTGGIDGEGALLVRVGGDIERIVAGEVRWL
jgi:BirA family biotin operon repressor/biotin-[acetyl-CoA-carboxylase] ligase